MALLTAAALFGFASVASCGLHAKTRHHLETRLEALNETRAIMAGDNVRSVLFETECANGLNEVAEEHRAVGVARTEEMFFNTTAEQQRFQAALLDGSEAQWRCLLRRTVEICVVDWESAFEGTLSRRERTVATQLPLCLLDHLHKSVKAKRPLEAVAEEE